MYFFHNIDILAMAVLTAVRVMRGLLGAGARIGRGEGSYLVRRVGGTLLVSTLYFFLRYLTGNIGYSIYLGDRTLEYLLGCPWTAALRATRHLLRGLGRIEPPMWIGRILSWVYFRSNFFDYWWAPGPGTPRGAIADVKTNACVCLSLVYMVPFWAVTITRAVRSRRSKGGSR